MLEVCAGCGTQYAAGLPACPQCWTPTGQKPAVPEPADQGEKEEPDA